MPRTFSRRTTALATAATLVWWLVTVRYPDAGAGVAGTAAVVVGFLATRDDTGK